MGPWLTTSRGGTTNDFMSAASGAISGARAQRILELAAPQPAEQEEGLTGLVALPVVHEHGGVDAEAAGERHRIRHKGALRVVCLGVAYAEDSLAVLGRKEQVVHAVGVACHVRRPQLLARPRHVLQREEDALVAPPRLRVGEREHPVVTHVELVSAVGRPAGPLVLVVRGVDPQGAVEHMTGGVSGPDVAHERQVIVGARGQRI
eukprot:scaffold19408_cov57-Phaeocystis_antarctica.AAC.1